jgi:O-antigen chain-terminating methyltransferase
LDKESPDLLALRKRLEEEESAYAAVLDAVDALAVFPLPLEALPDLPALKDRLNALWEAAPPPQGSGLSGRSRRGVWTVMAPALARQQEFNSTVVQLLNGYLDETARLHARLRDLVASLVRYLQRVLPVVDAKDRMATAHATTRAELILEAFDRRQESLGRRVEGLLALRDRVESLSEELRALRSTLAAGAPPPAVAQAAERAADDSVYVAFENRFRGSREDIRSHLASYVTYFDGLAPVVDLGCGRGEFLELLGEKGIAARGVEGNAHVVQECRERGLDVVHGDLLAFLRAEPAASLGGIFAAQVAEHLPPAVLQALFREAHRSLRPGGVLILETVNTRSVLAFLEGYLRDLTHERPLHPETLRFLASAHGFSDVRIELCSPVDPSMLLRPVPRDGLPEAAANVLDENVRRLNDLLFGPQDYALLARR